jgi:PKD repeat protein
MVTGIQGGHLHQSIKKDIFTDNQPKTLGLIRNIQNKITTKMKVMKKLLFQLLFLMTVLPLLGQDMVTVSGYVTDDSTALPIPDQEVIIQSDSGIGGFVYYGTVYTDVNGFYVDTILINTGDSGNFIITTYDCQNVPHSYTHAFGPGVYGIVQDFQICYNNTPAPCEADFTWSASGGLSIQFYDQSVGTSGPWTWSFGDGTTSAQQNPLHDYAQSGTYSVTLTIGDSSSPCYDWITKTVVVNDSTGGDCQANFTWYTDSTNTSTVYFQDLSQGNIVSWYWDFGDGNYSYEQNPVHTYNVADSFMVCLTVTGYDSACYDTHCEVINVYNPGGCQAQFTHYPDSTGGDLGIQFVDLSFGNITNWYWDFGDSTFSSEQNPSHIFPAPGTYYVCLTVQGMNAGTSCTSTWCEEVVVSNIPPGCPNYFTYQNTGLSVSFEGHMVNSQPATYTWNFGDGTTGTGQNVTHQYAANGIYFVSLTTVTQDSMACTYTSSQSITVGDSTQWNQVYGQVFAGNFPLETGMVMIFSLDTTGGMYAPFIDITMVDSSGVYYFAMVPEGEYVVYALPFEPSGYLPTYYGDVLNWEDATTITLGDPNNPYNISLIEATVFAPGIGLINGQINTGSLKNSLIDKITMLLMNESGQPIAYQQVDDGGAFNFPELDYGIYYLHAEIAGCHSDYIKVEITSEEPEIEVTMTFTGNQILGIKNYTQTLEGGYLYPNPAKDKVWLSLTLDATSVITIELFDLTGKKVLHDQQQVQSGIQTLSINTTNVPAGYYTLRVTTTQGMYLTRKLLITQ